MCAPSRAGHSFCAGLLPRPVRVQLTTGGRLVAAFTLPTKPHLHLRSRGACMYMSACSRAPLRARLFHSCRYERANMFPYNAGVILLNMPFMKRTNDEFIDWILRQHNGLDYGRERPCCAAA